MPLPTWSGHLPTSPWPLQDWSWLGVVDPFNSTNATALPTHVVVSNLRGDRPENLLELPPVPVVTGPQAPVAIDIMQRQLQALDLLHAPFTPNVFDAATQAAVQQAVQVPIGSAMERYSHERDVAVLDGLRRATPDSISILLLGLVEAVYTERLLGRVFNALCPTAPGGLCTGTSHVANQIDSVPGLDLPGLSTPTAPATSEPMPTWAKITLGVVAVAGVGALVYRFTRTR